MIALKLLGGITFLFLGVFCLAMSGAVFAMAIPPEIEGFEWWKKCARLIITSELGFFLVLGIASILSSIYLFRTAFRNDKVRDLN